MTGVITMETIKCKACNHSSGEDQWSTTQFENGTRFECPACYGTWIEGEPPYSGCADVFCEECDGQCTDCRAYEPDDGQMVHITIPVEEANALHHIVEYYTGNAPYDIPDEVIQMLKNVIWDAVDKAVGIIRDVDNDDDYEYGEYDYGMDD